YGTAADLTEHLPYEWTFYTPIDTVMSNLATMTCRQLVGKAASHASDPGLRSLTRKFAVLMPVDADVGGPMPGLGTLLRILNGCGVSSPKVVRYHTTNGEE